MLSKIYIQLFLPVYLLAYLYVLGLNKIYTFRRSYQINPVVVNKKNRIQFFLEKIKKTIYFLVLTSVVLYAVFPRFYHLLLSFEYLTNIYIQIIGIIVLIASLVFTRIAQNHMKASWRIGINYKESPQLITEGLFKYSRNPVSLGMIISALSLFFVIPNCLTLIVLVLSYIVAEIMIMIEEKHSHKCLGEEYIKYLKSTRKWI